VEEITLRGETPPKFPELCCCCLNEREVIRKFPGGFLGILDVPWCRSCRRTRHMYLAFEAALWLALFFLLWIGGFVVLEWLWIHGMAEFVDGWIGERSTTIGGSMLVYSASLLAAIAATDRLARGMELAVKRLFFRRSGHAFGCDAFRCQPRLKIKDIRRKETVLVFKNLAYARKWREMNGMAEGGE
jgi:hypothetical protein